MTEAADALDPTGSELPLGAEYDCGPEIEILMGEVETVRHPYTGETMLRRLPVQRPRAMADCAAFRGTGAAPVPAAWLVPSGLEAVIELLTAHGIRWSALAEPAAFEAESFTITASTQSEREFQGHRERKLEGNWAPAPATLPAGTVVVPSAQPLGRLAFYLLEPRSDDGVVAWNVLDEALEGAATYPILRTSALPAGTLYREPGVSAADGRSEGRR